jgi:hypothetical protein
MNNTQLLRFELMKRIQAAYPTAPPGRAEEMAADIEATGAYQHDGTRIVPVGSRGDLAKAKMIAPTVCGAITSEYVQACSSSSSPEAAPLDRAAARLRAMGLDMDSALSGDDSDTREFYGLDLSDMPKGAA